VFLPEFTSVPTGCPIRSSGNNVNNSTNTGDAYVDEVLYQLQQQQQHGQPVGTEVNSGRNFIQNGQTSQRPLA
jgi:hypothetical protein